VTETIEVFCDLRAPQRTQHLVLIVWTYGILRASIKWLLIFFSIVVTPLLVYVPEGVSVVLWLFDLGFEVFLGPFNTPLSIWMLILIKIKGLWCVSIELFDKSLLLIHFTFVFYVRASNWSK